MPKGSDSPLDDTPLPAPPPEETPRKKKKKHHHHTDSTAAAPAEAKPSASTPSKEEEPDLPPPPKEEQNDEPELPATPKEDEPELPPPPKAEEKDESELPALPTEAAEQEKEAKKKKKKKHTKRESSANLSSSGPTSPVSNDDQTALPPLPLAVAAAKSHSHHRSKSKSQLTEQNPPVIADENDSGPTSPTTPGSPVSARKSGHAHKSSKRLIDSQRKSELAESSTPVGTEGYSSSSSSSESEEDIPPPPPPLEGDEYSNDDDLKGASDEEELPPIPEIVELKEELKKKKKKKKKKHHHHKKKGDKNAADDIQPPEGDEIQPPPPVDEIQPPPPVDIGPPPPPVDIGPPPPPIDIPPPPPCSIYPPDMMKKRFLIVNEILSTEKTYVSQLGLMVTMFVDKDCGLNADQKRDIFSNVKVIATCHNMFVEPLEQRVRGWTESSIVSDLFLEARWIKLYKHYINQYDAAALLLKEWRNTKRDPTKEITIFKKYLKEVEWTPALQCTNLESLLVTPIQRLPRYVLLLEEMAKVTPEDHPDHGKLSEAIGLVRELTDYVNKSKKESSDTNTLRDIEEKLVGLPFELVQGHRELVKEGALKIDKDAAHLWLFNDIAFVTKSPSRSRFKFKNSINLNTAKLTQAEGTSFKIVSTDGLLNVVCQSVEDRMMWVQKLTDTFNAVQAKNLKEVIVGEVAEAEGSKQFNELMARKMVENRAAQFKALLRSEKAYLHSLEVTRSTFLNPIKKMAMDKTNTLMSVQAAKEIIFNFSELRNVQKAIVRGLKAKKSTWDEHSTVSDVFKEHIDRIIYLYREYIEHSPIQTASLNACLKKTEFGVWVSNIECQSKLTLTTLLALPMRRISEYYFALEKMLQNTSPKDEDYAALSEVVKKISALNEEFTVMNNPKVTEASRRATPRQLPKKQ